MAAAADTFDEDLPLSAILEDLSRHDGDFTLSELIDRFGASAFGAVTLVFAIACALPMPPGSSTVLGAPLLFLTPQIAMGANAPWLPRRLRAHRVPARDLRKVCERMLPWLRRIERVSRPRLHFFFTPLGVRLMGAVAALLSFVLILPIPLGNLLPAAAVAAFSLALILRDGVLAVAGYVLTLASTAVLVVAAHLIIRVLRHVLEVATGA
jgi:hypothetical protein